MAFGSARELEYQTSLARRLGYLVGDSISPVCEETSKVLGGLIRSLRKQTYSLQPKA